MDKAKTNFFIITCLIFIFFIFETTLAKSTDKKKLMNLFKEGTEIIKRDGIKALNYKEFNDLMLKIENEFILEKINFKNKQVKADILLYVCLAHQFFYVNSDRKIVIEKCVRGDNYWESNNLYKGKKIEYKQYFHHIIGNLYAWEYIFRGKKKNYNKAIKYSKINFEDKRKRDMFYSTALKNYTIIYRASGEFKKSLKYQKLTLENWDCFKKITELSAKNQKRCMQEFSDYAVLFMDVGGIENEKKAKEIIDNIINIETKDNYDRNTRNSIRVALFQHYLNKKDFENAERTIYEAIEFIADKPDEITMYYENMVRLYNLMIVMGHGYEAKKGLVNLLKKIEEKEGSESLILIGALGELIRLYNSNYYTLAELDAYNKKLIKILNKHKKTYKLERHISLATVAGAFIDLGKFKEAEKFFKKSIEASPKEENNNLNLGLIASKIKLKKFDEAKKILIEIEPQNTYQQIGYLEAEALIYKNKDDLINYTKSFYKNYSFYSNYAEGLISEKGAPSVQYYAQKIMTLLNEVTNLSDEDYVKLKNRFNSIHKYDFDSAIVELFEIIRTSKFNKRVANIIERSQNPKIEKEKRKLQELQIEFEKLPKIAMNDGKTNEIIKNLKVSKEKIDKKKREILSILGNNNLNTYRKYNLEEIQKNINNNQVIISYFFDQSNFYIILLSNDNFQIRKIRKKNKQAEDLIIKIRESLNINDNGTVNQFDISNSNKLYNLIIKPIEKQIQNKSELIIIPHKSLNSLPFEILLKSAEKNFSKQDYTNLNWFGKNFAISYYPSIYSYLELKNLKSNKNSFSFVGLGDPKFKKGKNLSSEKMDIDKVMLRGIANPDEIRNFSELPETRDELNFIAKIFKNKSKLYLGNEFNEDKIKSIDFRKYKFISFATHAVIANQIDNIGEPGLILTPPVKANNDNDGILTVSEIERLKLNSDIVILSACNTASEDGSPNANGLSGLTSAFFQAGTRSMLVTHWDVETNSAVYLTTNTFEKLENTKNLSIALQKTKNEMMNNIETSHPLFWAPFILVGNLN